MKPILREVEIGPHFLTFYVSPNPWDVEWKIYRRFIVLYPELADIQQKGFQHQTNDPKVYHPYGSPKNKPGRTWYYHFHIRYKRKPTLGDIERAKKVIGEFCDIDPEHTVTLLEDFKEIEVSYPEMPDSNEDYLKLLDEMRGTPHA